MANIVQGKKDKNVKAINFVLDEFESTFPGAIAHLYRRNSVNNSMIGPSPVVMILSGGSSPLALMIK